MNVTTVSLEELDYLVNKNQINNMRIDTPTGYEIISDTYRKYSTGKYILFSDGTMLKCADKHLIKHNYSWKHADEFRLGDILHLDDGSYKKIISIKDLPEQDWIDFTIQAEHSSYYLDGILHHNSGKSHQIYLVIRYILKYTDYKILLLVPKINLVEQMEKDFKSYINDGYNIIDDIHKIYGGVDKFNDKRIVISTYQSLIPLIANKNAKYDRESVMDFFKSFECFICDEVHYSTGKSITSIIEMLQENCKIRIGYTGTLNDSKIHELQLKGLYGPIYTATTSKELQDIEVQSELNIEVHILEYPQNEMQYVHDICKTYQKEIDFMLSNSSRNDYIVNTALNETNNTLIMFYKIAHGKLLRSKLIEKAEQYNKKIVYIAGEIKLEERELIRELLSTENNLILLATYGTIQEGFNAPNIHTIIFAHPFKGKIRNLQSIGRGLRRIENSKEQIKLIDIGDNFVKKNKKGKITKMNYCYKHLLERLKIYEAENFAYVSKSFRLNEAI